jgi:hypothetical protein
MNEGLHVETPKRGEEEVNVIPTIMIENKALEALARWESMQWIELKRDLKRGNKEN